MSELAGIGTFGSLTSKYINSVNFDEFDIDKDGIITQEEVNTLCQNKNFDILDLSSIDKNADKKVTEDEYILWQQESEIKKYLDEIKNNVAKDFIGGDQSDIIKVINALEEFKSLFIKSYPNNSGLSEMANAFKSALPLKYIEIKQNALKNSKTEIKSRVIEKIITELTDNSKNGGRIFTGILYKNTLSDNAKRLLKNILSKQADKFIKSYDGENLENALENNLKQFLIKSDKEELSEAINFWEISEDELNNLSEEIEFAHMKNKAKNFLIFAIEKNIPITVGKVSVRTEVAITPALAQFKDKQSLKEAIDYAIKQLSTKTKLDKVLENEENELF